jgi:hypothetical protein
MARALQDDISTTTLAHYDANAEDFREGTRDHEVRPKHLQRYLDEFVFRFDRYWRETELFIRVLPRSLDAGPCPYQQLTADRIGSAEEEQAGIPGPAVGTIEGAELRVAEQEGDLGERERAALELADRSLASSHHPSRNRSAPDSRAVGRPECGDRGGTLRFLIERSEGFDDARGGEALRRAEREWPIADPCGAAIARAGGCAAWTVLRTPLVQLIRWSVPPSIQGPVNPSQRRQYS